MLYMREVKIYLIEKNISFKILSEVASFLKLIPICHPSEMKYCKKNLSGWHQNAAWFRNVGWVERYCNEGRLRKTILNQTLKYLCLTMRTEFGNQKQNPVHPFIILKILFKKVTNWFHARSPFFYLMSCDKVAKKSFFIYNPCR
jgi:hypothetical protein